MKDPEDGSNSGSDDPNAHDDHTEIPEHIDNPEPPVDTPPVEEPEKIDKPEEGNQDPTEADVIEAQQVGLLFEAVGNSLGWNMDEIDEKDKPLNTEQLAQYASTEQVTQYVRGASISTTRIVYNAVYRLYDGKNELFVKIWSDNEERGL